MLIEGITTGLHNAMIGAGIILLVMVGAFISQMPSSQPKPTGLHYPRSFHLVPCGNECNK